MSQIQIARRAIRLYSNSMAPKHTNRHNQHSYIAMLGWLGDRWILAKPISLVRING